MQSFKRIFAVPFLIAFYASVAHAEWGNLTGRFIYDGPAPQRPSLATFGKDGVICKESVINESLLVDEKTGGVGNTVVYLLTKDVKVHPDYERSAKDDVTMAMQGCRFDPHIVLIRVGQTLVGENKDPIGHNFNFSPPGEDEVGHLLLPGPKTRKTCKIPLRILAPVYCNIHPWMRGYVLCRDNPYMAVTKPDGSFEIKLIPAGDHEFQFLHEEVGYLLAKPEWKKGRATFTIKPGETTDLGEIKLDPKFFVKQKS